MVDVKSLWSDQKPDATIVVRTKIDIPGLNCFVATNNVTGQWLYIMSVSKSLEIPELKSYRFKGIEIFDIELEDRTEITIYLLEDELSDVFALFIQNVVDDIIDVATESDALAKTLKVVEKWKKLFDTINFSGLRVEQQKGLCGELLFINWLLDNQKKIAPVLNGWTGVDFGDKDFVFGATGVEVKLTSSKYPKVSISSERQLDTLNIDELYLVLYIAEEVRQNGFTLNSLISQIRLKIAGSPGELKLFNEKLLVAGYMDDHASYYGKMYALKQMLTFAVTGGFPRITRDILPPGVYDTAYFIELSAAAPFSVLPDEILKKVY
ncbi:PD-(D/E)XK motif protein [Chitinophaga horti]|uniref:PD-(D/E)XK motif protein n=1 Tax=Chitinophaga horti TaxID=2920382 RepID=A0ABY6J5L6_9BACT|nr:PD-(D/E)XK motif protein [Chitinophaga horti]UYQ94958.1 PD-(D/E)XK motif protein [Chitinophaga horti]